MNHEDIESMYPIVNGICVMPIQECHLGGALAYNKFVGSEMTLLLHPSHPLSHIHEQSLTSLCYGECMFCECSGHLGKGG
ncbi:LOW QUALITY PROTEIN: hypothetical protein ACHAW6_007250 [Cyclotella cf. meneghiniana]